MTPGLREPVVVNYPGMERRLYLLPRSSMARDPGPSSGGEDIFAFLFLAVALVLLELISRSLPG